jgi:hypothetical protein
MFGHHILKMYLRHRLTKVCILRRIALVTSHVSHPYRSTDFTQPLKILDKYARLILSIPCTVILISYIYQQTHTKCIKLQITYVHKLCCMFRLVLAVYRETKIRRNLFSCCKQVEIDIQGPPKKCIHTLTDGICVLFSKLN